MRITETDRLLCLLSDSLETLIFPELQSQRAQATVDFIRLTLAELRKRENDTPALLHEEILAGQQQLLAAQSLLARLDAAHHAPAASVAVAAHSLFDALVREHADLTEALAQTTLALQRARSTAKPEDQDNISALLLQAAQWEERYGRRQREQPCPPPPPREADASTGPLRAETLQAFLRTQHPHGDAVSVTHFEAIPGGFGKQTTLFTLRDGAGCERDLIARKMDPAPLVSTGLFNIEREFHLLQSLSATGYPAPTPLYLGSNVAGIDAPFYVMERLPGKVTGSYLSGMRSTPSEALLFDIAAQMARLHTMPLAALSGYIDRYEDPALLTTLRVRDCYAAKLAEMRRYQLEEVEHLPSPTLTYLADWLQRQMPADDRRPVLVHGDFNIHNLLIDGDRVSGVLDWECAMFGAPEQELAYIQPHISQLIDWERFIAHYEHCAQRKIDRATMAYYLAFSMFPVNIAMNRGVRNVQSGLNRDARYLMIELAYGPQFLQMALAATNP